MARQASPQPVTEDVLKSWRTTEQSVTGVAAALPAGGPFNGRTDIDIFNAGVAEVRIGETAGQAPTGRPIAAGASIQMRAGACFPIFVIANGGGPENVVISEFRERA